MNLKSLMFPLWFLLLHGNKTLAGPQLSVVHQFIVPKYVDGSPDNYIEKNAAIVDVDYWKDKEKNVEKIFVTTPRQKAGVPASLSIVVKENLESKLSPYPSWEANKATCDGIVSAFRTMVDSCDRLWVIDTGVIESATDNSNRICTPKVWIFDLKTDKLISKHPIPNELLKGDSLLITIVVDIRDKNKCDEAFAYIADTQTFQIIVFDLKNNKFWQFRNRYMFPTPADGNFNINGVSFDLMDGILGLSLGPVKKGDRTLYFHSLASKRESCVPASALRNSSLAGDLNSAREYFKISTEERTSQSAAEAMTDNGIQFFGLLEENTLACWASKPAFKDYYRRSNVVRLKTDNELLQFISGIKVVGDNLFILSSRLQDYFTDQVKENEYNYRVIRTSVNQITKNTRCYRSHRDGINSLTGSDEDNFEFSS